jgi:ribosome-associated protein
VICSTGSERQTSAILRDLDDKIREEFGRKALGSEGRGTSGWVLLDFGDVVVHMFTPEQRAHYDLEELWSGATTVVRVQ